MVNVKFFGLIRSNHNIKEITIDALTINDIITYVKRQHPAISIQEFSDAALFLNGEKLSHMKRFETKLHSEDIIIFTNYVGGG